MRRLSAAAVAGLLLAAAGGCGLALLPSVVRWLVASNVALRNGTETYRQFVSPSVPVRIQFYVFYVLNAREVLRGEKPALRERGPFTYAELRRKVDIRYDPLRDWLTYKQNRSYHFLRNESVADESYSFVTVNIPLVTIVNGLRYAPAALRRFVARVLADFPDEALFVRRTVRDMAFGYHDRLLRLAHEIVPQLVYTDYVGVLAGLNNTYDGEYTICAGNADPLHLGEIQAFNGTKRLSFWSSELANTVLGSDGSLAPPFLNRSALLPAFISDICRLLYGVYDSQVAAAAGIAAWRFTGPDALLANASDNPDNAGYCTPPGHCLPTGLVNLTQCKTLDGLHLPIVVSLPHFLLAAASVRDRVIGLAPNNRTHRTFIDIEPLSGIVLQLYKRLQVNVYLPGGSDPAFSAFGRPPTVFLPVLWLNESAVVDEATARLLDRRLLLPQRVAFGCFAGAAAAGCCVSLAAAAVLLSRRRRREQQPPGDAADESPNLDGDKDELLPQRA